MIQISLGIKFQLNQTICIFWSKFAKKTCFGSIRIRLNTKFHFKQTLKFCSNLLWTDVSVLKKEKIRAIFDFHIFVLV